MKLYLVQHARPKPKEEDPERPLSDEGRLEATKMAKFLSKLEIKTIIHSGKLRAQQTAEIFANFLKVEVKKEGDLEPLSSPKVWYQKLQNQTEDLMIVGHLPHLEKLVSLLLCNDEEKKIVEFQQGGVVCLEKTENWTVRWTITPDLL